MSNDTEYRIFVGSFGRQNNELYGRNFTEELHTFANDTVLVNVPDDKWHWTWKALSLMSWANDYCPNAEYFVHVRDSFDVQTAMVKNLTDINCGILKVSLKYLVMNQEFTKLSGGFQTHSSKFKFEFSWRVM